MGAVFGTDPVVALQRWLYFVAALRFLAGETLVLALHRPGLDVSR
jgi:hypothetical protein